MARPAFVLDRHSLVHSSAVVRSPTSVSDGASPSSHLHITQSADIRITEARSCIVNGADSVCTTAGLSDPSRPSAAQSMMALHQPPAGTSPLSLAPMSSSNVRRSHSFTTSALPHPQGQSAVASSVN